MVMIRFTGMFDKILDLTKTRTIRKKRKCNCLANRHDSPKGTECKCQIEKGDTVQIYLILKVGEGTVTNVQELEYLSELSDEDARLDGFKDRDEAHMIIEDMHKDYFGPFYIIDWNPHYPPRKIVDIDPFYGVFGNDDSARLRAQLREKLNLEE